VNDGETASSGPSVADNERDEHIAMLKGMNNQNKESADFNQGLAQKDIRKGPVRWVMLFMACCFLLGSYFCYDIPATIKTRF